MLRPTPHNLGDAISRDGDPTAPALIDVGAPGGPRTYSYGEFDALANAVARGGSFPAEDRTNRSWRDSLAQNIPFGLARGIFGAINGAELLG